MHAKSPNHAFSLLECLIALALGALIMIGVFHIYASLNQLRYREQAIATFAENTRFITLFLRNKINQAGDWSCASSSPSALSKPVEGFDSESAKKQLGLTIKSDTDLLQLRECVKIHERRQYQPIQFYIANTYRKTSNNQSISALFFKVAHHPREELITGMTQFQLTLGVRDHLQKNILSYYPVSSVDHWRDVEVVRIRYQLTDPNALLHQSGLIYATLWHQTQSAG